MYLDGNASEYTDVVFSGVLAYHFENDNLNTIFFDIAEVPVRQIYAEHKALFDRLKNYGWPEVNYTSEEHLLQTVEQRGVRGYELSSSYGLYGWVWAQSMAVNEADAPQA